jgi:nucleoside-diphosphate-sugar epimerase
VSPSLVIGARGFIGSNVVRYLRTRGVRVWEANRETPLDSLTGEHFAVVYFCAGNSRTYLSEREPLTCLNENVATLYAYLTGLRYDRWVHLSSSAVYPQNAHEKVEDMPLPIHELSMYGAHKLLSELYVTRFARRWVVVRPTSFYGPGLKKNLLFDLRAGQRDVFLKRDSVMDYIPIETFADILHTLAERAANEIVNVGSGESLTVGEILAMKPNDYIYHDERFHSDAGMSFERLRAYYPATLTRDDLREAIRAFLHSEP